GVVLADHIIVKNAADVARTGDPVARLDQSRLVLLTDDIHAELGAFVADEDGRTRDQLPDFVLALAAEGTVERVFRVATAGLAHRHSITASGGALRRTAWTCRLRRSGGDRQAGQRPAPSLQPRRGLRKYMCS